MTEGPARDGNHGHESKTAVSAPHTLLATPLKLCSCIVVTTRAKYLTHCSLLRSRLADFAEAPGPQPRRQLKNLFFLGQSVCPSSSLPAANNSERPICRTQADVTMRLETQLVIYIVEKDGTRIERKDSSSRRGYVTGRRLQALFGLRLCLMSNITVGNEICNECHSNIADSCGKSKLHTHRSCQGHGKGNFPFPYQFCLQFFFLSAHGTSERVCINIQ